MFCPCVFFTTVAVRTNRTRRPDLATRQRDRRGEHGRGGRPGQSHRAAVLRCRLATADRHVVAGRPDVADDVRPVRTAPRPFAGRPAGDGQRARPVHVPGVQRTGPGGVLDRDAPGAWHARRRSRPTGQPVPGAGSQAPDHW